MIATGDGSYSDTLIHHGSLERVENPADNKESCMHTEKHRVASMPPRAYLRTENACNRSDVSSGYRSACTMPDKTQYGACALIANTHHRSSCQLRTGLVLQADYRLPVRVSSDNRNLVTYRWHCIFDFRALL
jgi:hypothetical protein